MKNPHRVHVLVCGAGPTGLVLALWLARSGVRVRIIDAAAEPGTTSRALVVHARTLEFYRQMGLADALLAEGLPFTAVNMWVRRRRVARAVLGDMGKGLSPFPFMFVCTQDRHERFLIEHLRRAGVEVERPVRLVDFTQDGGGVAARLEVAGGDVQECRADYLAGCDGARSTAREVLGVGFPGGTYERIFYVADVEATGPVMNDELHVALDDHDFVAVFPLKGGHTARLIGTVRAEQEGVREALTWDDVGRLVAERMGIHVQRVNWFSTYRVHHRVADRFLQGRAFLLGDAAHIHSPVGGQGMNTGIGDAVNLAWKLADVLRGRAPSALLDTYAPERMAFARRLIATTDRGFTIATSPTARARLVRTKVLPHVLPAAMRLPGVRRLFFRTVSQIAIHYRGQALSAGKVGPVEGGDRLPWVELEPGAGTPDNHAVLDGREWQVHVYGTPAAGLAQACAEWGVALHVFGWQDAMDKAGLTRDALYLVRPDGYVALADGGASLDPFLEWARAHLCWPPSVVGGGRRWPEEAAHARVR
ncbi:MAG TPA: FAD-dependent monooxygenase [Vicinamibacteria bacterium]|nr:FAD-dependent monooxygenase [Vicinamibacteria bacterium]